MRQMNSSSRPGGPFLHKDMLVSDRAVISGLHVKGADLNQDRCATFNHCCQPVLQLMHSCGEVWLGRHPFSAAARHAIALHSK